MKRKIKLLTLLILKYLGGFHLARFLTRRGLRILCYHGFSIGDQHEFEDVLFVRLQTFERRIKLLKKWKFPVIPLTQAVEQLPRDVHPDHSTVITFDDGWYSTASAQPILNRHSFPSTLYVSTWYADRGANVFNVLMRYLFWKTRAKTLKLQGFGPSVDGTHDLSQIPSKAKICRTIIAYGDTECDLDQKGRLTEAVAAELGIDLAPIISTRCFQYLNTGEMKALQNSGMDLQLHTHRHRFPYDQAGVEREINDNRASLSQVKPTPCNHLCYPSGVYSEAQIPWLRHLGLQSATTTDSYFNWPTTSLYKLGRFLDRETLTDLEFEAEVWGVRETLRWMASRRK